jgi:hypothetical protein
MAEQPLSSDREAAFAPSRCAIYASRSTSPARPCCGASRPERLPGPVQHAVAESILLVHFARSKRRELTTLRGAARAANDGTPARKCRVRCD